MATQADPSQGEWERWPERSKLAYAREIELRVFRATYRNDPAAFVMDCIDFGERDKPTDYQLEICADIALHHKEAVRGPHGLGKTAIAAWAIHWFALTRDGIDDWKAPTTASVWRQLSEFLWPEVHKWGRSLIWDKIGREPYDERLELQTMALRLSTGSAFAVASDQPSAIEGAHADQVLYVYDEAKSIRDDTVDASEGAFSGAGVDDREAFALMFSTPGDPNGRFYDIHSRKAGYEDWHVRHVKLDEAIAAGRISADWAEQREKQWGRDSALFQNRVEGEFASTSERAVIPLRWVEEAQERWRQIAVQRTDGSWAMPDEQLGRFTCLGVDVADEGPDRTVVARRHDNVIAELRSFPLSTDTMETAGHVVSILRPRVGERKKSAYAIIDSIGIGAGVKSRVGEQGYWSVPFNAAEGTSETDRSGEIEFANKRAAAWWGMRERLDPNNGEAICLPPTDQLTGDLTAPTWKQTSAGKLLIESKDDIRNRLARSTDHGDAVVMAFYNHRTQARIGSAAGSKIGAPRGRSDGRPF